MGSNLNGLDLSVLERSCRERQSSTHVSSAAICISSWETVAASSRSSAEPLLCEGGSEGLITLYLHGIKPHFLSKTFRSSAAWPSGPANWCELLQLYCDTCFLFRNAPNIL